MWLILLMTTPNKAGDMVILESKISSYNMLEETSEQQLATYNALICDEIKVIRTELGKIENYINMPEHIK